MKTTHALIIAGAIVLGSAIIATVISQNEKVEPVGNVNRFEFSGSYGNNGEIYLLDKQTGQVFYSNREDEWHEKIPPVINDK